MIQDFVAKEDLPFFTSGSRFSLASVFLAEGMEQTVATFDLLVRELPPTRNYLVFSGLEHAAEYLLNLKLSDKQLKWLERSFHFDSRAMEYFRSFRFTGDLWAMPEGTPFFPNEPIIRVTAPIVEAQLVEMFLINAVYLQTILASKMSRFVQAANGKKVGVGFNRSYGTDAAMKSARINEMLGVANSLALYHYKHESTPFSTGTFHYLIMAFENELDAFRAYLKHMKGQGYVLIDTYGSTSGIKNFIRAAKEVERDGIKAVGIQLDSGDIYKLSVTARKMLDASDLRYVKIFAMGNLDEWKVAKLEAMGAPIDVYAGVTELLTPTDAPTIELVYKLSELQKDGKKLPKMKTSTRKMSLPGRKQVFRVEKSGHYVRDVIALEDERLSGKPLLIPVIKRGTQVYRFPALEKIRGHYQTEMKKVDPQLLSVSKRVNYPVSLSTGLRDLLRKTQKQIASIHHEIDLA